MNDIIPRSDDLDICFHVEMLVGAIYHHQQRIKTDVESNAVSVKWLMCSMFEGFETAKDIRYMDVLNENRWHSGNISVKLQIQFPSLLPDHHHYQTAMTTTCCRDSDFG